MPAVRTGIEELIIVTLNKHEEFENAQRSSRRIRDFEENH